MSILRTVRSTCNEAMNAPRPRIRPTFAMLEPITLPRARPGAPLNAASMETNSSGRDVPNPITMAPTTVFGTR